MRYEVVGSAFFLDLVRCLADHERFGLGEVVRRQHLLMLVVLDWVVGLGGKDEVGGDELGTLVQELEEGVLSVGARLAEKDRASGILHVVAGSGNSLSVGLHGELLEVCREAVHVLVEAVKLSLVR